MCQRRRRLFFLKIKKKIVAAHADEDGGMEMFTPHTRTSPSWHVHAKPPVSAESLPRRVLASRLAKA